MKRVLSVRALLIIACLTPLLTGAQEAPASQPSSAPASLPASMAASLPIEPTSSVKKYTPDFTMMFGVYSRGKKKRAHQRFFEGNSADAREVSTREEFTIGVTANGETWKLWSAERMEGPFLSMKALLKREKLTPKRLYCIETTYPDEPREEQTAVR